MPLFAKGYNDLILRSYNELPVWQNYLRDNPRRLLLKRACPALLRPFFGLQIGNHCYSGIGNRALLAAPCRIAVRVSRRLNVQEVQADEPHGTGNLRTKDIPTGATLFRRHNKKENHLEFLRIASLMSEILLLETGMLSGQSFMTSCMLPDL